MTNHIEAYMQELDKDRRLSILLYLTHMQGYTSNSKLLQRVLRKSYGHALSYNELMGHLEFLAAKALIDLTIPNESENFAVITLTQTGRDVASGTFTVAGVQEPLFD